MIGMILGNRYELVQIIGEGGMAIVYKAKDVKLNRWVAVKVLKKEFADNKEISEKFRKEATAIANLSDMNIVSVLDVGHEEDSENMDYFVMEYVEGKTLKDIIVYNGRLSYSTSISIGIQIAKALECAHKKNIIHRDVKPENILVTEQGDVKVTDFGIAKSSTSSTITNTTTIMGSAHYLSPEQAKGSFMDGRSDIYSLGIVLYEMATGKLPFQGESPVTIALKQIQDEAIQPKSLNPTIPESLNNLIIKCMKKDPLVRYQSTKDLIVDLQKIKEDPDVVIGNAEEKHNEGKTIVMSPINVSEVPNIKKNTFIKQEEINDLEDEYEEEDDSNYNKKNKKSKSVKVILLILSFLVLGALAMFVITSNGKGKESEDVTLPNIISKNYIEAEKELAELGIDLEVISNKASDKEKDIILEANPVAGNVVKKGTVVKVVISSGEEMIKVPDLRDREINYIKEVLEQKGIKYKIEEVFDDEIERGYLVSQSIEKDTEISKDEELVITISKGQEVKLITIENYLGLDGKEVEAQLLEKKLKVTIKEQETNKKQEDGKVLDQSLNLGNKVAEGTTITLTVAKYVEPNIDITSILSTDMTLDKAIEALKANGIEYDLGAEAPATSELNKYKVISFTNSIKAGEKVQINYEKIEEEENPA